jgi:uncharacterized hydrophobic protein (TIGR00271 family)
MSETTKEVNKSNPSEETASAETPNQSLWDQIKQFVNSILTLGEIDFENASKEIRNDIVFKGFNVWILFFSVLICSIGLNLNSPAVVIGAMLISPLMGPINGIGFALAIIDRELLLKSIKSFTVAVIVSITAAFLFFKLAPTSDQQSELLARTRPTLLDLFVALFGGLAGILASVRRIKNNVIPGVAIATALMPPLCTAGYGLATAQWNYFLGAFYLFFINSVFISLSALLVTRYLRFPLVSFMDRTKERIARTRLLIFIALVSIPSIVIYINVIQQSLAERRMNQFVNDHIDKDAYLLVNKRILTDSDPPVIELGLVGNELKESDIEVLKKQLPRYNLASYELKIYQSRNAIVKQINEKDMTETVTEQVKVGLLKDYIIQKDQLLEQKDSTISLLKTEKQALIQREKDIQSISNECSLLFPDIQEISYNQHINYMAGEITDSTNLILIRSKSTLSESDTKRFESWVKERLQVEAVDLRYR